MMRTIDFMKNTHSTRPIMVRMIPIAECFYKEKHNMPFKDSPFWPYFRNRKTHLLDGVFHAKTLFSSDNLSNIHRGEVRKRLNRRS